MKSHLIHYTDRAIRDIITGLILDRFPNLHLGDTLSGPTGVFCDGKKVVDTPAITPTNFIKLDHMEGVPKAAKPRPRYSVTVSCLRFNLQDIEDGMLRLKEDPLVNSLEDANILHPYVCLFPAREWLEEYDVGDEVSTAYMTQETFEVAHVQFPLTQEIIDRHSTVLYRYATFKLEE